MSAALYTWRASFPQKLEWKLNFSVLLVASYSLKIAGFSSELSNFYVLAHCNGYKGYISGLNFYNVGSLVPFSGCRIQTHRSKKLGVLLLTIVCSVKIFFI